MPYNSNIGKWPSLLAMNLMLLEIVIVAGDMHSSLARKSKYREVEKHETNEVVKIEDVCCLGSVPT